MKPIVLYLAIALMQMEFDAVLCLLHDVRYRPVLSFTMAIAWPVTAPLVIVSVIKCQRGLK